MKVLVQPYIKAIDIRYFLVILLLVIVGFSIAFLTTFRSDEGDFENILWSLFSNYRFVIYVFGLIGRLVFGDSSTIYNPDLDDTLTGQYFVISRLLYIGFSFIVSLILLNILIAIMSNSFNVIQVPTFQNICNF